MRNVVGVVLPKAFVRKVIHRLPAAVQPKPVRPALAPGLDPEGRVADDLRKPTPGASAPMTSAAAAGRRLYRGSLTAPPYARYAPKPVEHRGKKAARKHGRPS